MADDLIIKNGTLIDGTGAARRRGDVAIKDGLIAAVGDVEGAADRVIDASDLIVSPGFIDPHTHYDAQICWDGEVTPSAWHGVTSVVMGNCGVGIAPCLPGAREIAMRDPSTSRPSPSTCWNRASLGIGKAFPNISMRPRRAEAPSTWASWRH